MPSAAGPFVPAWWLPGPHLPTLWAARARPAPRPAARPERLELPDGDFVDLAWLDAGAGPLVIILHGLEGGIGSPYVRRLMTAASRAGWGACLMHFRGCSGQANRLPRSYHSGDTGDLAHLITVLKARFPGRVLAGVGYSMGGNVLLGWLGTRGHQSGLDAAAVVSVPFELAAAACRLNTGFSRVYQAHLLASLRARMREKLRHHAMPFSAATLARARSFEEYDEWITAPLHGFAGAADYYARASSRPAIPGIRIPTLILHARDDPFLPPSAIPEPAECPPEVQLEITARGGHVAFITDPWPGAPQPWLETRLMAHLAACLASAPGTSGLECDGSAP